MLTIFARRRPSARRSPRSGAPRTPFCGVGPREHAPGDLAGGERRREEPRSSSGPRPIERAGAAQAPTPRDADRLHRGERRRRGEPPAMRPSAARAQSSTASGERRRGAVPRVGGVRAAGWPRPERACGACRVGRGQAAVAEVPPCPRSPARSSRSRPEAAAVPTRGRTLPRRGDIATTQAPTATVTSSSPARLSVRSVRATRAGRRPGAARTRRARRRRCPRMPARPGCAACSRRLAGPERRRAGDTRPSAQDGGLSGV
jgi:hypothetical protein